MLLPSTVKPRNFSDTFCSNERYAMVDVNTRKDKKTTANKRDKRTFSSRKNNDLKFNPLSR
jgi:hypothetical protein